MFDPFEVTTPHVVYALLGGFIVLFGMFSLFLRERLYVGEAVWAFIFGIVIGPYCANIFNPRAWSGNADEQTDVVVLEFTRIVLAIGVFAIGVELPKAYMAKHWRSLFFLLVPVMTWGWFVSAGLIYALIPGLNFLSSLAVAACLTPTDPILAAAVVGGKWADKHVPAHIRHLLAAESGCNDGAAFPFLFLALYLIIDVNTGAAIRDWFLLLWLYQVVLGAIIGSLLGFGFRHLMKFCQRHDLIDRHSYVAQYVSLAIFTIGVTTLLGSDDLLSAFFCGTAFAWDGFFNRQTEESVFSSVIDTLFNVAAFIFVGAWMPFNTFQDAALTLSVWRLIVLALLVLLLRRLPVMVMTYRWIPDIKTFREAVFCGHFGPIGVGAIFISTLAVETLHTANTSDSPTTNNAQTQLLENAIQPIVAFMVLCSIVLHGLSIPSFSLGRRVHSVSRTWSRRDTANSAGRGGQPEWQNQARLVSRAEDIVINRDVDLERGDGMKEKGKRKEEGGTESGSASVHTLDVEKLADSGLTEETRVQRTGTWDASPARAYGEDRSGYREDHEHARADDYRDQPPPDGEDDDVTEWIEGRHRVVERKMGPGSDVEVTVFDADAGERERTDGTPQHRTWQGKVHDLEDEIRPAIRRELAHLQSKARDAMGSPPKPATGDVPDIAAQDDHQNTIEHTVYNDNNEHAIDDEYEDVDEEEWASDASNGGPSSRPATAEDASGGKPTPPLAARSLSKPLRGAHHAHHAMHPAASSSSRKRRASVRRSSVSAGDVVEPPRGRQPAARPRADPSVTFARTHHPNDFATSRPGTGTSTTSGTARLGTPPSAGPGNVRHSRLETIRAMHTSTPPTRESSPARSVRFVNAGGQRGVGADSNKEDPARSGSPTPPSGSILE